MDLESVRHGAATGDDGGPQYQGSPAGQAGFHGRNKRVIPLGNLAIDAAFKRDGVDSGYHQEDHLGSKEVTVVRLHRLAPEQENSGDYHDGEANKHPRLDLFVDFRGRTPLHDVTHEAQIRNQQQADGNREGQDMDGFDDGEYPNRLADGRANVGVLQPLAHTHDGHLAERLLGYLRAIMICQLNG